MEQKVIATVGGHQITEAEVEAFIHSLPREQQAYAAHPDFRKQCEEQLIAVYAFAKYGEEEKIDETEEFKNVMENARKDILAQMAMRKLFATVNVTEEEIKGCCKRIFYMYFRSKRRRPWRVRKRTDGERIRGCCICCRDRTYCRTSKDTVWISSD